MSTKAFGMLVIYASQTGTAQSIAETLVEQLSETGVKADLLCCSQVQVDTTLRGLTCVLIVAATTGDGEPPDTACKLWNELRRCTGDLAHLSYTVLGLGDTNYNNFCNFGKNLDKQLQALGAHRFYECGWADDGTGLEEVVEPWCEGLPSAVKTHISSVPMQASTPPHSAWTHHSDTDTKDGENSPAGVSGTPRNDQEPNSNKKPEDSLHENSGHPKVAVAPEDKDVVSEVAAHHGIDLLPQHEVEYLPLRCCVLPKDDPLSIPALPPPYLALTFTEDAEGPLHTGISNTLPSAASQVVKARVDKIRQLTHPLAVKTALEFTLELPDEFNYQPGDSFGILAKSPQEEVELLLAMLKLQQTADKACELSIIPNSKKRAAAVPSFLPCKTSIRYLLQHCVDIRAIPKKPFLRALAEHTTDSCERRRLLELVSKQGTEEYACHVREACLSTLDLLFFFRSCRPPVTTLLEHLPRLLPRPYSAASSQLDTPNHLAFVFNVIKIPRGDSMAFSRQGICTGWLASLASRNQENVQRNSCAVDTRDVEETLNDLTLAGEKDMYIDIYLRNNQSFRPPKDSSIPVIMVGPGTGVAPFVGFLKHRQRTGLGTGEWWLFYGCRHKHMDFLYQKELRNFEEEGTLNHLIVSYSREAESPKYVQDNIVEYGESLAPMLDTAVVYVCGDARNMAKNVFEAFVSVVSEHNKVSEYDARILVTKMQQEGRYLQDVWT